jgi:hypothetical protein
MINFWNRKVQIALFPIEINSDNENTISGPEPVKCPAAKLVPVNKNDPKNK